MKQLLFINACVRQNSRTNLLARHLLSHLQCKAEEWNLEEVNLEQEQIQPLNQATLAKRDQLVATQDFSDPMFRYAQQFQAAHGIVLAAPHWDLAFPATVKIYLEAITIPHITFRYLEDGRPQGLCNASHLFYVTTAGGTLQYDFGFPYVKSLAQQMYGIPDVQLVQAENLDLVGADVDQILADAKERIHSISWD